MLARGPELRMEIVSTQSQEEACAVRIIVSRGKKNLFKDDILLNDIYAERLRRYIKENFIRDNNHTAMR